METTEKKDIRALSYEELAGAVEEMGEKPFRARQLFGWLHKNRVTSFEEMKNLPKTFLTKIKESYDIFNMNVVRELVSKEDGTRKYLFELYDGNMIESVMMPYQHGNSVCISSQAGCRMGCRFCASTLLGLARNLTAGEMLGQIYTIEKLTGNRVSHVVVMGSGEPMDNYEEIVRFVKLVSHEEGINISQRNLTVSTCGLVENVRRLAKEQFKITLAISLHAPNDEVRKELMPVANRYTIEELLNVCDEYFEETGRRITFEYSLVEGVNDQPEHAEELAQRLRGKNCHVNLIPVNPVEERNYRKTKDSFVERFKIILEKNRINVTIRRRMGSDIDAACGQLRMQHAKQQKKS